MEVHFHVSEVATVHTINMQFGDGLKKPLESVAPANKLKRCNGRVVRDLLHEYRAPLYVSLISFSQNWVEGFQHAHVPGKKIIIYIFITRIRLISKTKDRHPPTIISWPLRVHSR